MKKKIVLILTTLMCICLCACGNGSSEQEEKVEQDVAKAVITTNEGETVELSCEELMEVYDANEAKFDKLYQYAKIEFTGTIKSIKTETSVIVEKGQITARQHKVIFEEGWCLVVGTNNTKIDLADLDPGMKVEVVSSIVGAPFDTDFIKEVCENERVVWLVGNDEMHYGETTESDVETTIAIVGIE